MKLVPDRAVLWQFLRILLACGLGELAGLAVGLRETYWALITALVVTRPEQSDARGKAYERTLGSVIGGTVGLGVIEAERAGLPKYPLFVAALVALALVTARWSNMRLAAITLIVVVLVPSSQDPAVRPFDRVVEIFLGSLGRLGCLSCPRCRPPAPPCAGGHGARTLTVQPIGTWLTGC